MSDEARPWDALAAYIRQVADKMGLTEWRFRVPHDPVTDPSNMAEVRVNQFQRHAIIQFDSAFWGEDPDAQREVVVHELLHCPLDGLECVLSHDVAASGYLPAPALELARASFRRQTELVVDLLAPRVAEGMPLPAFGEEPAEPDVAVGSDVADGDQRPAD